MGILLCVLNIFTINAIFSNSTRHFSAVRTWEYSGQQRVTGSSATNPATKYSAAGTRTRVARVRAEYPNQLDYGGYGEATEDAYNRDPCPGTSTKLHDFYYVRMQTIHACAKQNHRTPIVAFHMWTLTPYGGYPTKDIAIFNGLLTRLG